MKEISQEEAKRLIIDILDNVDTICKQHNLRYTLSDGTLLGAVRHKGFIPWDDDIDICMPREDYELFRHHFNEWNTTPHLKLLDFRTEKESTFTFLKVYDNRTGMVMARKIKADVGINIDVFPLDNIPGGKFHAHAHIWLCHYLKKCGSLANRCEWNIKDFSFSEKIIRFIFRILTLGAEQAFFARIHEFIATRHNKRKCPYISNVMWRSSLKRGADIDCVPASAFDSYTELEFEGKKYPCISGYHEYLTHFFGDYMTPPPVSERTNIHLFKMWWK